MLPLTLDLSASGGTLTVLVLGAHADDIEIGCGGTILHLAATAPGSHVHWVVLSGDDEREAEARASAAEFLGGFASSTVAVERFRDGFFPASIGEIKERFEQLKGELAPDLILTHNRADLHQDHRVTCELTWNTFRDHLVLEYEIPKYDGDLGSPGLFVPLSEEQVQAKVATILRHFGSQRDRHWFTEDVFRATLRLRGMESNSPSGWAEAFHCRKAVLR